MSNPKLTTLVLLVVAFLSLPIFALAQTNPTIEVCSGTCYPTVPPNNLVTSVYNQILVNHDDGSIPGDFTYKRGSTIRIHSNVSDPGGVSYVKAIIEDALGNQLVIIPLFNDGASSHGDEAGLLNGSPTGKTDTIYSNLWIAPFKLQTGVKYYLHIEAADSFAKDSTDVLHIYKTDLYRTIPGHELEFELTDACLATCGTIGELRCSKNKVEVCTEDTVNKCNSWKTSAPGCGANICCGPNVTPPATVACCGSASNFCDVSTYTCLSCDGVCNLGGSCTTGCSAVADPNCDPQGCCGDGTCNAGENPGTCNADCPDTVPPVITITKPVGGESITDSTSFFIEATITDDYNPILTNPSAVISIGATNYRTVALLSIGGGKFRSALPITPLDIPVLNSATYTVTVTASDIILNSSNTSTTFNIICSPECSPLSYPMCSGDNKQNCVVGGDGCYDIVTETNCTSLFGGDGVCRNNNCCEQNCDIFSYVPSCNLDGIHLNSCVAQADGCNRENTGIDCRTVLSNPSAVCRSGGSGANCCLDACTPGAPSCNGTGTAIENCVMNAATGCYVINSSSCTGGTVCKDTGSGGATCCTNACSPLGGTDLSCDSSNIWTRDCGTNTTTGCTEFQNADNCSLIPPITGLGFTCKINSSTSKANCCENECTGSTAPSCSGNNLLSCSSSASVDGCFDNLTTDCSATGDVCKVGDIGANCCEDECTLGEPLSCNTGHSATLECQVNTINGCTHRVTKDICPAASGQVCIDGSPAFCGVLDTTPPVVSLNYPVPYDTSWVQNSQVDFETPGFTTFQTNTTNNPGSVGLSFEPAAPITSTDGNVTISTARNINTDIISSLRSCADGISYNVILLGVSSATLSSTPNPGCLVPGDIVMLTNLQGTLANNSNTGNYEFLTVQGVAGSIVSFTGPKTKFYGNGLSDDTNIGTAVTNQRVILQRVPRYNNVTVTGTGSLTTNDWNGVNGGVLVFFASGTVNVNIGGSITTIAKGYRTSPLGAGRGESIGGYNGTGLTRNIGGGGGHEGDCYAGDYASGGGSYGGAGQSFGGAEAGSIYGDNQLTDIFLGSAGGAENAGQAGDGGGIIYINANNIIVDGLIDSDGSGEEIADERGSLFGGGGSGGSVYLKSNNLDIGSDQVTADKGYSYDESTGSSCEPWSDGPLGGFGRTHLKTNALIGNSTQPIPIISSLSPYYLTGTYTSAVYDTVNNNSYNAINWNTTIPVGTSISVVVKSCTTANCADKPSWVGCTPASNGSDITGGCVVDGNRYVQYQITFNTSNPAVTPTLDRIEINYNQSVNLLTGSSMVFIANIIDTSALSTINPPRVQIQNSIGVNIGAPLTMYDDGAHGDGAAGDKVYGTNPWNSAGQPLGGYFIDLSARDIFENLNTNFNNIGYFVII